MGRQFRELSPDETELCSAGPGPAQGEVVDARIDWLVRSRLRPIAMRPIDGGPSQLCRDLADGRYWNHTFPAGSEAGPQCLTVISEESAVARYRLPEWLMARQELEGPPPEPRWPVAVISDDECITVYATFVDMLIDIEQPDSWSDLAIDAVERAFVLHTHMDPPATRWQRIRRALLGYAGEFRMIYDSRPVEPVLAARARAAIAAFAK